MGEKYVFPQLPMPPWVESRVMVYRTIDGGVAYEIDTGRNIRRLYFGDTVVKGNCAVKIIRGPGKHDGFSDNSDQKEIEKVIRGEDDG